MEPACTHAMLAALQVPGLAMQTLHLADQLRPLAWLDTRQRPEVATLVRAHRLGGPLTFQMVS